MNTLLPQQKDTMKNTVLSRIEHEGITPASKWICAVQEYGVWVLWALTVLFGALSVAVLIFASVHVGYAMYEATHDSPLTFIIEVLPYIWLAVFAVMAMLAHYNLRHTKRGYRYSLWQVLGSSLVFSIAGGTLLHVAGVGYLLDTQLGKMSPMYVSQEEKEVAMWQMPERGRLVGHLLEQMGTSSLISFEDVQGVLWKVNVSDLHLPDMRTLQTSKQVKLIGVRADMEQQRIHACGVFPWMFFKEAKISDIQTERQQFIQRIYEQKNQPELQEKALTEEVFGDKAMGLCADMPVIKRIEQKMKPLHP